MQNLFAKLNVSLALFEYILLFLWRVFKNENKWILKV